MKLLLDILRVVLAVLMVLVGIVPVLVVAAWLMLVAGVWPYSLRQMRTDIEARRVRRGLPLTNTHPSRN